MNAELTSEIRELTDTELDAVSGGIAATDVGEFGLLVYMGAMIPFTIGCLWEWIFGDWACTPRRSMLGLAMPGGAQLQRAFFFAARVIQRIAQVAIFWDARRCIFLTSFLSVQDE
jgi:hypothetical protein